MSNSVCKQCKDIIIESDQDALAQHLSGLCDLCFGNQNQKISKEKLKKSIDEIGSNIGESNGRK